jgi:hypothetical protein
MTTIKSNEISFVLSGGVNNNNPSSSIGGNPSNFPVIGSLNNLFADLTTEEAQAGKIDHRCFYLKNLSKTDSLYDAKIFISSQSSEGASVQIGLSQITDEQEIEITGAVLSGSLLLKYGQQEFLVNWGGSASSFSANLLAGLNSVGLNGVELSHVGTVGTSRFKILFKGSTNNRSHPKIDLYSNNLSGLSKPVVSIKKIVEGQPINSIAPLLAVDTVPPARVEFRNSSNENQIELGTLYPEDFVPIWIRRYTPANTDFVERDFFVFKLIGSPF